VLWFVGSILLGLIAVTFKGTVVDPIIMILALIGISMPVFWLGEVVNLITQDRLHDTFLFSWVPPLGYTPLTEDPWQWFLHLIFPWITLSILYIGFYARVLRADLLENQSADYVRTARAKGLGETQVVLGHALRNSLIVVTTIVGVQLGVLISGAVVTEQIFVLPGFGKLTIDAVFTRDYPLMQGVVLVTATAYIGLNLLVDLLYSVIDPRVRVGGAAVS
jgi:peptide/nickel transport system permease protein